MIKLDDNQKDALLFAKLLRETEFPNEITFGNFILKGTKGIKDKIQSKTTNFELLQREHEYTFPILEGDLKVSLQLYEKAIDDFRLCCYTYFNGNKGLVFSINLVSDQENENLIHLTQKIEFSEENQEISKDYKSQKQTIFCDLLRKLQLEVSDKKELSLGVFDINKEEFVNTSFEKFLNDFIVVSILNGHFQGDKGYQLEVLPNYEELINVFTK